MTKWSSFFFKKLFNQSGTFSFKTNTNQPVDFQAANNFYTSLDLTGALQNPEKLNQIAVIIIEYFFLTGFPAGNYGYCSLFLR